MDFCIARKDSEIARRILEVWPSPTVWDDRACVFRGLPFDHDKTVSASDWLDDEEAITGQALFVKIEETIQADHEKVVLIGKGPLGPLYDWMGENDLLPKQEEI